MPVDGLEHSSLNGLRRSAVLRNVSFDPGPEFEFGPQVVGTGVSRMPAGGKAASGAMPEIIYHLGFSTLVADHPVNGGTWPQSAGVGNFEGNIAFFRDGSDAVSGVEPDVGIFLCDGPDDDIGYRNGDERH